MAGKLEGPFVEIRLVDGAGNVIKKDGEACEDQWEFDTLGDAYAAFEEVAAAFDEAWGPEGEEGEPREEVDE